MFTSWFNIVDSPPNPPSNAQANSKPSSDPSKSNETRAKTDDPDSPVVNDNFKSTPLGAPLVKDRSSRTSTIKPPEVLVKPNDSLVLSGVPLVKDTRTDVPLVADKISRFGQKPCPISKGSIRTVKSTHPVLGGKSYRVEGSIREVLGIDDPWMSPKTFSIPAVSNYIISQNPPAPYHGTVYYGKIDHLGYCVHEDYL